MIILCKVFIGHKIYIMKLKYTMNACVHPHTLYYLLECAAFCSEGLGHSLNHHIIHIISGSYVLVECCYCEELFFFMNPTECRLENM